MFRKAFVYKNLLCLGLIFLGALSYTASYPRQIAPKICGTVNDVTGNPSDGSVTLVLRPSGDEELIHVILKKPDQGLEKEKQRYLGREVCVSGKLLKSLGFSIVVVQHDSEIRMVMSDNIMQSLH